MLEAENLNIRKKRDKFFRSVRDSIVNYPREATYMKRLPLYKLCKKRIESSALVFLKMYIERYLYELLLKTKDISMKCKKNTIYLRYL